MNRAYIINYNTFDNPEDEKIFIEAITSNFVSKKVRENTYAIVNEKNLGASDIHKMIKSKIEIDSSFIVVSLQYFYGDFLPEGLKWIKETFTEINWIN